MGVVGNRGWDPVNAIGSGQAAHSGLGEPGAARGHPVDIRFVTDEADEALRLLGKLTNREIISDGDWARLFATEGYTQLKRRELSVGLPFAESELRSFLSRTDVLDKRAALQETLARWTRVDLSGPARRALAYLPDGIELRATIYPVIKEKANSFVFGTPSAPAIFLYLDPQLQVGQLENMVAHEFHHIGYAAGMAERRATEVETAVPSRLKTALEWLTAFREGFAVLAAAGGPDIHPHAGSPATYRSRWDRDVARVGADLLEVERFVLSILDGRLTSGEEIDKVGNSFFGVQGPWYTVGWHMATTIEKAHGRERLVQCMFDPVQLLAAYNETARAADHGSAACWSDALLTKLRRRRRDR